MNEIVDHLPPDTRKHYLTLRDIRSDKERKEYDEKLRKLRSDAAARGILKSGMTYKAEWEIKAAFIDSLALGYVEEALATCRLYNVELTPTFCASVEAAARDFVGIQYRMQIQNQGMGVSDVKIPNSAIQAMSGILERKTFSVMPYIKVLLETARVEDVARRQAAAKQASTQKIADSIHFHGHNPRLNVNSTDNSTNVVSIKNDKLFTALREKAELIVDESERQTILERVNDMQEAEATGGFIEAYQKFISVTADHIAVFGPLLPMLAQLLSGN